MESFEVEFLVSQFPLCKLTIVSGHHNVHLTVAAILRACTDPLDFTFCNKFSKCVLKVDPRYKR